MGFFDMPRTESAEDMLEKFRVRELVEYERFCRDNALWDSMLACFAQDSRVEISWYQGSGQGFVEASKKMKAKAPHKLNNTLVWLNGRARRRRDDGQHPYPPPDRRDVGGPCLSGALFIYGAQRAGRVENCDDELHL